MGDFVSDDEQDFDRLLTCAREIVLPGAAGLRVPEPRGGGWYDVDRTCIDLTDELPAYGSV